MSRSHTAAETVAHSDVAISGVEIAFDRFLRMDVVHFRHRLFSGAWSERRSYDVLRRGSAVAVVLYDPERDAVVLVAQFRLPALLAGSSPWQIEATAGLVDGEETPEAVAVRETREETGLSLIGKPILLQHYLPSSGDSDERVFLFCGRIDSTAAAGDRPGSGTMRAPPAVALGDNEGVGCESPTRLGKAELPAGLAAHWT